MDPYRGPVVVQARWATNGGWHTASLRWKDPVRVGDLVQVWVDTAGNPVDLSEATATDVASQVFEGAHDHDHDHDHDHEHDHEHD